MNGTGEEIVKIKKSRSLTPWIALVAFALTAASVYCLLVPLVFYKLGNTLYYLFIGIGSVGTLYFAGLFIYEIVQLFSPKNALIVSDEGFLDLLNGSAGAGYVPWGNVTRMEHTEGEKPLISISLLDPEAVQNAGDKKLKKQLTSGESGMPALYIKPYQIAVPLDEAYEILYEARERFYRGAAPSGQTEIFSNTGMRAIRGAAAAAEGAKAEKKDADEDGGKSIDELLKELSGEIEKRRQKLSGDDKKSSEELEDIIRYIKEKK